MRIELIPNTHRQPRGSRVRTRRDSRSWRGARLAQTGLCLAVLVLAGLACTSAHAQKPVVDDPVKAAVERFKSVLRDPDLIPALECSLRPSVWSGLTVTIRVGADETKDGQGRVFTIGERKMSEKVDPSSLPPRTRLTIGHDGQVVFSNQEDAFAKGVPFYVTDVGFESPTVFHYTVVSNPAVPVDHALMCIQENGEGANVGVLGDPLKSDASPQRRTMTLSSPPRTGKTTYLSIVVVPREWGYMPCIASNEVLLDSKSTGRSRTCFPVEKPASSGSVAGSTPPADPAAAIRPQSVGSIRSPFRSLHRRKPGP